MVQLAAEKNFALFCYGTVAGGFLGDRWLGKPEPDHPLENRSLTKYKLIIDDFGGWDLFQALLSTLRKIADRHQVDIATVASAAMLTKPGAAAVIVGARNRNHLPSNLAIADIALTVTDLAEIEAIRSQAHPLDGGRLYAGAGPGGPPRQHHEIQSQQRGITMRTTFLLSAMVAALAASTAPTFAADCDITVGLVMELTGPAGEYGQAGAKSVEMAFRDFNDAGGVDGCKIVADTRDSQSQGNVAVDQATQLVNIKKVPVIIGGIISSVSIPILTSVTAPAGIVQVSPASSSPTLTELGREGKTNGVFFRTITSDALQGTAAAKYALDQGLKKIAIINVNNDFGVNMVKEFITAYEKLGGTISSTTPYNEEAVELCV